jgi:hypothetical protein
VGIDLCHLHSLLGVMMKRRYFIREFVADDHTYKGQDQAR